MVQDDFNKNNETPNVTQSDIPFSKMELDERIKKLDKPTYEHHLTPDGAEVNEEKKRAYEENAERIRFIQQRLGEMKGDLKRDFDLACPEPSHKR
jgi:hypothetical protein